MAWRVTSVPSLRRTIESGPSVLSRETSLRRVSSPRAANSGAASLSFSAALRLGDMALDVLQLFRPATGIVAEGFRAAFGGEAGETRFDDREPGAFGARVLELEFDERHRLGGVVMLRIDRVGAPAIGEIALGHQLDDLHLDLQVLVPGVRDPSDNGAARAECALEPDAKPQAELCGVTDRPPNSRERRRDQGFLFDPVIFELC